MDTSLLEVVEKLDIRSLLQIKTYSINKLQEYKENLIQKLETGAKGNNYQIWINRRNTFNFSVVDERFSITYFHNHKTCGGQRDYEGDLIDSYPYWINEPETSKSLCQTSNKSDLGNGEYIIRKQRYMKFISRELAIEYILNKYNNNKKQKVNNFNNSSSFERDLNEMITIIEELDEYF